MQLTQSLKAPGFNPRSYQVKPRFQAFAFKSNLFRYTKGQTSMCLTDQMQHMQTDELSFAQRILTAARAHRGGGAVQVDESSWNPLLETACFFNPWSLY
jgi:hypothetical protein